MSRKRTSNQQSKGVITVRRSVATGFVAVLVATTTLAAVAIVRLASYDGASNHIDNKPARQAVTGSGKVSPPESGSRQAEGDEVQIALGNNGFTPSEVTHAAGTFALAVENQDVSSEYVLQLKGGSGTLLNEVRVQKGSAVWTVDLPAGSYTLMVANHPDWVCQITIQ